MADAESWKLSCPLGLAGSSDDQKRHLASVAVELVQAQPHTESPLGQCRPRI